MIKKYGYNVYDIGLSPQRNLDEKTDLSSLNELLLDISDLDSMTEYINNLEFGQSNFLFMLL